MSKKKKALLISFMAVLIAGGAFSYIATRVEGRSTLSKLIEVGLWLARNTKDDEKALAAHLETSRLKNEKPYKLPSELLVDTAFQIHYEGDMQVVTADANETMTQKQLLYLHGGAYVSAPSIIHWSFLDIIAKATGIGITAPLYPRAPAFQFTDAYDRLIPLYRSLLETHKADDIILMGDSAGGGLALGLAEMLTESGLPQPGQIILISPWLDISMDNPALVEYEDVDPMLTIFALKGMGQAWAGTTDVLDYRLSPLFGDLQQLAPITLFIGTHELFLPDARLFRDLAEDAGLELNYFEYERMNHVFPLYPIPEAALAQAEIIDIILNKGK